MALSEPKRTEKDYRSKLDLLFRVGQKVGAVSQMSQLVDQIVQMTQHTLRASASSVLLLDEEKQELSFEVAKGEAGKQLKNIKLSESSGVVGWVVQNQKPVIINDVSKDERFNGSIDRYTSFQTRSILCAPLVVHSRCTGVIEVLNRNDGSDFTPQDLEALVSVASTAAISIENLKLNQTILESYKSTVKALVAAIDAKDPYTSGHSQRVTEFSLQAAKALAFSRENLEDLEYGGILHDIGKIGISDNILSKPGALTEKEWEVIRQHPLIGARMIEEIPFLKNARDMVLLHHERYDGKGYPHGVSGNQIPMGARLLAVADAYDSMTTDRPYRAALSTDTAINELVKSAGTQFCPDAVNGFTRGLKTRKRASRR